MRAAAWWSALLLGLASAAAQSAPRKALIGKVTRTDGASPAGAQVTLWGIRGELGPAVCPPDVVAATADARGLFVAKLLPGVPYCGFAATAPDANGGRGASELVGWFGAGAEVELACGPPWPQVAVPLRGVEAWSAAGPLTFALQPAAGERSLGAEVSLAIGADGQAILPPLFLAVHALAEVRDRDGALLCSAWRPAQCLDPLQVPPPRELTLRAFDESGQPFEGAALSLRIGHRGDGMIDALETGRALELRALGRTGADGAALVRLPMLFDPWSSPVAEPMFFVARAPGRSESTSGFWGRHDLRADRRIDHGTLKAVEFVLRRASKPRRLRIQRGDAPAAGMIVHLQVSAKWFTSDIGYVHDVRTLDFVTDREGVVDLAGLPTDGIGMRCVLVEPTDPTPVVCAPWAGDMIPDTIDLATVAQLDLQLRTADERPLAGRCGYLGLGPAGSRWFPGDADRRLCTDTSGTVRVRIWPAGKCEIAFIQPEGVFDQSLDLEAGSARRSVAIVPPRLVRGQVLDPADLPVGGARIRLASSYDHTPVSRFARERYLRTQERLLVGLVSAADGTFALPCLDLPGLEPAFELQHAGRTTGHFGVDPELPAKVLRMQ